ncbi:sigma-70 family RNA polymerase sigma factor [Bordetella sp. N]|uniref:sigma-70 family RNA polymerase sigma factor n=1 Tax=Bordetella sp. N TaxID=1746199 RepID=UPI00070F5DC3|nr:sigma-70 family RNA polymerase sigma factor [Bordetella sp. N]ALM84375.1 hypothetical protein ASB57_16610 [Bordetella sp. N]
MSAESPSSVSFQRLYTEHRPWLVALLRRKLGNAEHAAELAQDTFERLLRSGPGALSMLEPRAYLTTVATRLATSHFRRQALEKAYLEVLAMQPEPMASSPEDHLLVIEALETVWSALDGLSPRTFQAFMMAQIDGQPYADVGASLNMSVGAVQKAVARGLERCYLALYA